jgi:hypothetical protein
MASKWYYSLGAIIGNVLFFFYYRFGRVDGVRIKNVPVVKRNATDTYHHPVIVYWVKGDEEHQWYKAELLCSRYPNGEVVDVGENLNDLSERLQMRYTEMVLGFY